jgi:hypothetical protein
MPTSETAKTPINGEVFCEQGSGNVFADLDFVVDLHGGRLIGNPEHGGEHVMEVY